MKTFRIVLALAAVAIVLVIVFFGKQGLPNSIPTATSTPSVAVKKTYTNPTFGIDFTYPADYTISEKERGDARRSHYVITLIHDKDIPIPSNSDGPTSINIDIFKNNLEPQTLLGWFKSSSDSGFKVSDTYASSSVSGIPAISYSSSGLYERDVTAFLHESNIFVISSTYIYPTDIIRNDRQELIQSLKLLPGTTTPELI